MAKRRRGEIEELLREKVRRHVRGPDGDRAMRGRNKELATAVGRPESWVTEYLNGENHANLDTSLALIRVLKLRVGDFVAAETSKEVREFLALDPEEQRFLLEGAEPRVARPNAAPIRGPREVTGRNRAVRSRRQ